MTENGFDYVIVGEPTDLDIQIGTRGVAWIGVYFRGEQIHATRPHRIDQNVMEALPAALERMDASALTYENNPELPEPSLQATILETTDTYNSIPGEAYLGMDIRYLPSQSVDGIVADVERSLGDLAVEVDVTVDTDHGGAFLLEDEEFKQVATEVLTEIRGERPAHITSGGASDGRFFSERGTPFIELGVNQEPVHQADEYCHVENLEKLREAYYEIVKRLARRNQEDES